MDENKKPEGEETIERLLRLAGPRTAVPDDEANRIRSIVHSHWRASLTARRRRRTFWMAGSLAAASLILLFIRLGEEAHPIRRFDPEATELPWIATLERIVGVLRTVDGHALGPGSGIRAGTDVQTGSSDRAALLLVDGTSLRIDHDTRLKLLTDSVVVLAQGAIYADTGQGKPSSVGLEIRTRFGMVRDVGTQLQVRLDDTALEVSVREGVARLERGDQTREANAGFQLSVEEGGRITTRESTVSGAQWSWILQVSPPFALEGHSLGEFLDWVERENGWRSRFTDPTVTAHARAIVLHGTVEGLMPDEAPAAVLPTCGLRHRLVGNTLFIEQVGKATPSR